MVISATPIWTPPPGFSGPQTPREKNIVGIAKIQMPPIFLAQGNDAQDIKILEYIKDGLAYVNNYTPATDYSINSMPSQWDRMIVLVSVQFSVLFAQLGWTLQDFSYSDNGLQLTLDRVPKLDTSLKNFAEIIDKIVKQMKYQELLRVGGKGLGTPRFQSQIGQFLKIALGTSFNWSSP